MCVCSQSSSLSLCVVRRPCKERSDLIAADWSHQFNQASPPLGTRHTLTPKSLACILIASASKENHGRQQKHCIKLSKLIIASIVHVWQRLSQEVPFHFLSIGNAICSHCSHICSIDDFFFLMKTICAPWHLPTICGFCSIFYCAISFDGLYDASVIISWPLPANKTACMTSRY